VIVTKGFGRWRRSVVLECGPPRRAAFPARRDKLAGLNLAERRGTASKLAGGKAVPQCGTTRRWNTTRENAIAGKKPRIPQARDGGPRYACLTHGRLGRTAFGHLSLCKAPMADRLPRWAERRSALRRVVGVPRPFSFEVGACLRILAI